MPGLLGAVVAVGPRALARGADMARDTVGQAAPRALSGLWRHARAVPVVVGAAPARQGGGNRRGAAARRWQPPVMSIDTASEGHRQIARGLDRPPGTVRGWLRAGRSRAESLRARASRLVVSLDHELVAVTSAGSGLGDAGEAMMLAVRAWVLRFGHRGVGRGSERWVPDRWLDRRPARTRPTSSRSTSGSPPQHKCGKERYKHDAWSRAKLESERTREIAPALATTN